MRWTGRFLVVLALLSLGCARGDWTSETLTLVDVTGTWDGSFRVGTGPGPATQERPTRWVLRQKGGKVRGEAYGPNGVVWASVEGLVNGETFGWQATGKFWYAATPFDRSYLGDKSYRGEATVNSDEM